MVVGLEKKVVFREGNCHGNRKLRGDSAKHFARAILRRNWIQTWLNLANDSISSKVIRTQTEQFLELFIRTLNFFAPLRCENIIVYYCLTERRMSLALDARVLLLHCYDRLSRIFSCRLLIRNQNIFSCNLEYISTHQLFQRPQIAISLVFETWRVLIYSKCCGVGDYKSILQLTVFSQ